MLATSRIKTVSEFLKEERPDFRPLLFCEDNTGSGAYCMAEPEDFPSDAFVAPGRRHPIV